MKFYSILPTPLLAAYLAAAGIAPAVLPPADPAAPTTSQPAPASMTTQPGDADDTDNALGPAAAERLLAQVEQATAELHTLRARIRYTRLQGLLGDEQQRFGDFYYAAPDPGSNPETDDHEGTDIHGPSARFAVHLDGLVMDDQLRSIDQWFIYDGRWLLERDEDDKSATRRELRPAHAEPDGALALDSNSIPIPLQLKKDEVLAEYDATRLEDETVGEWTLHHLRLTPKRDPDAPAGDDDDDAPAPLDLWFDSATLLLTKVVTRDGNDEIELLFAPTEMRPNAEIAPGTFDTTLPDPDDGWSVQEVRLE